MRLAVLNDIHANLPALDAVLAELAEQPIDRIVLGGDVLPGPIPRDTLERLGALGVPVSGIYGNGELAVLAQLDAADPATVTYWRTTDGGPLPEKYREWIRWTAQQLQPDEAETIR